MFLDALVASTKNNIIHSRTSAKFLEEFSPITHFIASTILDFPDPLGPIIPFK